MSSLLVGELVADSLVTSGGHRSAIRRPARGLPLGREAIDPEAAGVVTVVGVQVAITSLARFPTATPLLCLIGMNARPALPSQWNLSTGRAVVSRAMPRE